MISGVLMILVHHVVDCGTRGTTLGVIRAPAIRRDDYNHQGKCRHHTRNNQRSDALRGLDHCYLSITGPVGRV